LKEGQECESRDGAGTRKGKSEGVRKSEEKWAWAVWYGEKEEDERGSNLERG
jgi:hypothetical protein